MSRKTLKCVNSRTGIPSHLEDLEPRLLLTGSLYTVTSLADTVAVDDKLTLREAIQAANTNAAVGDAFAGSGTETDRIVFAVPTLQEEAGAGNPLKITLGGSELLISEDLEIVGPGDDVLTIDANGGSRVLHIKDAVATLSGLTFTGGESGFGAGIDNDGTLVLADSTITDNAGVGIYDDGDLVLQNVTVSNNSSLGIHGAYSYMQMFNVTVRGNAGGGIYTDHAILHMTDSTISQNTSNVSGAGLINRFGSLELINVLVSNNRTPWPGGGLWNNTDDQTVSLTNVTFSGNSASSGGGISVLTGTVTLNNSIVALNHATANDDIDGVVAGANNLIGADPHFVRNPSAGVDTVWATADDDLGNLHLAADSPAIDAGQAALAVNGDGDPIITDFDGRMRVIGDNVDQGAYEASSAAVLAVVPSVDVLARANVELEGFWVTVQFAEAMDTNVDPTISFSPSVAAVLTFASGEWDDSTHYVAYYNVASTAATIDDVFVQVADYQTEDGTPQAPYGSSKLFDIDTRWITSPLDSKGMATFIDAQGNNVTVTLKGGGTGTLYFTRPGHWNVGKIILSGTTDKSALTISVKGTNGETIWGDIDTGGGPIGSIVTTATRLIGNVTIGASANPKAAVTLTFDKISDTSITSAMPIKSLTASEWLDDAIADVLTAPSVGAINIKGRKANAKAGLAALRGDFEADLNLGQLGGTTQALGSLTVAGVMDTSHVTSFGASTKGLSIGAVKVGRVEDATIQASGGITSVATSQWDSGSIQAAWVGSITTKANAALAGNGDFGADMTLTGAPEALKKLTLGSASIAGDVVPHTWLEMRNGNVGKLTVAGTVRESIICCSAGDIASITVGASTLSDYGAGVRMAVLAAGHHSAIGNEADVPKGTIKSFTVKGWKVPAGQVIPRFCTDTNITARNVKMTLVNWDGDGGLYVPADGIGTIKNTDTANPANSWTFNPAVANGFVKVLDASQRLVGRWVPKSVQGAPMRLDASNCVWNFYQNGTYDIFFEAEPYYSYMDDSGSYWTSGLTLGVTGTMIADNVWGGNDSTLVTYGKDTFSFIDDDGDRWVFMKADA